MKLTIKHVAGGIFRLEQIQFLPISLEQAWDFFSHPDNLNEITPAGMDFNIQTPYPGMVYPGLFIAYKLRPLPLMHFTWLTEITQVKETQYFIDEQRIGPYRLWHHEHFFHVSGKGVEMKDVLHYKLPFGFIGQVVHSLFVKNQIERIFSYRYACLESKFGKAAEV